MNNADLTKKLVAVFISTHETLRAEKFIKKESLPFRPVLKPRAISSNCQMGLRFDEEYLTRFLAIVEQKKLELTGIYEQTDNGWQKRG